MKDKIDNKIKGHFIVECLDKDKQIIDRFENHNLIMNNSRYSMSSLLCGLSTAKPINKFILGTEGHITGDYLTPKTEDEGFINTRTQLFSEETSGYVYPISFTNPGTATGNCPVVSEPDSGSVVTLAYSGTTLTYTIEIPELSANNTGIVVFSEAALYSGSNIFSMKCFPGKIKDETVSLKIIWSIIV